RGSVAADGVDDRSDSCKRPDIRATAAQRPADSPAAQRPVIVALLGAPDVSAATLYGFFDFLSSVRRDWQILHGGAAAPSPFRPLVVSRDGQPFAGANGVRITPDAGFADCPRPDIVCITDVLVPPGEPL